MLDHALIGFDDGRMFHTKLWWYITDEYHISIPYLLFNNDSPLTMGLANKLYNT